MDEDNDTDIYPVVTPEFVTENVSGEISSAIIFCR